MFKKREEVAVIIQARLASQRVPEKMIRPFAKTTLLDVLFEKLSQLKSISIKQVYISAYDEPIKDVAKKHNLKIFHRSRESAFEETKMPIIFEWHNKLPEQYKYVIIVSACNPLLKVETIDNFIEEFLESEESGLFAVIPKKTYYWDSNGKAITDWKGSPGMNTKYVDLVYEAAHCLYASRLDLIEKGYWMSDKLPEGLSLFEMEELEAFDIDYEWQFRVGEKLYEEFMDPRTR
jgi:CMP-N-acetylneuraminic acid synthetase